MSTANKSLPLIVIGLLILAGAGYLLTTKPAPAAEAPLVIYSGRSQDLVGPLLQRFETESGQALEVRYGKTAQMAATLLEEGPNSPADVFIAQDAGALGALAGKGLLLPLSKTLLARVPARFQSPDGQWVGLSGRARVVVYNTEHLTSDQLPDSIFGFTDPAWKGRIGWAPANGSFQAFVTALRVVEGEDKARAWLQGILANDPRVYPKNTPIVAATAAGEIDVGFVNHYYLFRFLKEEGDDFTARNAFLRDGDVGALINVAGAGILATSTRRSQAEALVAYLLSENAQAYFAAETYEYPLVLGLAANPALPPLGEISTPDLDLSQLEDLEGTLALLQELGVL